MQFDNRRQNSVPMNLAYPQNPVIQEIRRRKAMIEKGKEIAEGETKLGLVLEGGGMRGVISGGILVALEKLGLNSVFDEVYGESAGAINACYFLASQAAFGSRIYLEDLATPRFINPFRVNKIIDIDFLIDHVMTKVKPLCVNKVLYSRSKLFVSITNANNGTARVVDVKKEDVPLLKLLKATSAMTPLYNKGVLIDGIPYTDGGIADPIPVKNAINRGCTHTLVLLTRRYDYKLLPYRGLKRLILKLILEKWDERFARAFFNVQYKRYNESRDIAFGNISVGNDVKLAVICPTHKSPKVTRLTINQNRLNAAMNDSIIRALTLFNNPS
jgi:predicted patatin/cPLA2 family phospholipase